MSSHNRYMQYRKAELEKKMEELAGKVPYPKNIFDI